MLLELIIALLITPKLPQISHLSFLDGVVITTPRIIPKQTDILEVQLEAKSALLIDEETGQVLYEKNADSKQAIASITKLMTALVFLDQGVDMNSVTTMTKADRHPGGIEHFLIGEKIRIADVLYTAIVGSDNEAAYMLMHASRLNEEGFVAAMNAKAQSLGMKNSTFADPSGLDDNNISTARDLVLLLAEAYKQPLIADATTRKSYIFEVESLEDTREVKVYTTNQLNTSSYLEVLVAKTGYVPQAGYCLATLLVGQHKRKVFAIVLNSPTIESRFSDVKALEFISSQLYEYPQ